MIFTESLVINSNPLIVMKIINTALFNINIKPISIYNYTKSDLFSL